MRLFLQAVAAGSIKENGVFLNGSLLALSGRSFQACVGFHGQVHDFSALFTHIVVVGGCVIVKMIRSVAAGKLADFPQLYKQV